MASATENTEAPRSAAAASRIGSVAVPLPIRKNFSYRVRDALPMPEPGARVRVPFGERAMTGVVLARGQEETAGLREILEVVDTEPVCPPELRSGERRVGK